MSKSTNRQNLKEDTNIKYLVKDQQGEFVIELPATWRVTFANVNPAQGGGGGAFREGYCLRVYEGEKLRAVYAGVKSFRDLSIPLARKIQKETGSADWTMDSDGSFEKREKVDVETTFVLEGGEA